MHPRHCHRLVLPLAALLALQASQAQAVFATAPAPVKAALVALDESIQPGASVTVALKLEHAPHWHTYWLNPGTGYPTSLTWSLPDGWSAGEIRWPVPKLIKDPQGAITGNGYDGIVYLPVTLTAPAGLAATPGAQVTLRAKAEWLMCNDSCMPGSADVSLTLPVLATAPKPSPLREKVLSTPPMPGQLRGWKITATRTPGAKTIELYLDSAANEPLDNGTGLTPPHFFSSDGLVQYDAPQEQRIVGTDDNRSIDAAPVSLVLPVSDSYEGEAKRLVGVLVQENMASPSRGYVIDVPIGATNEVVPQTHGQDARATFTAPNANRSGSSPIENRVPSEARSLTSKIQNPSISPPPTPASASSISLSILLLAFLGGLILNLMPCVFPVLGIKILGFVHQAGASRRKVTLHGIVFTAGVLVSFWILATLLAILRAGGEQIGWGFQLQSAPFVFALAALLLVFALSMSGVFEFGLGATSLGAGLQDKGGYPGSFFTGVLATVVATPCAAPFLAPALGAALALPAAQSFLVFTLIALGLSTPYLLLSIFPGAIKILPRPGAWMETFKQLMAFLLYASAGALLWVLAEQTQESDFGLLWVIFGLVIVAMAAWLYGRFAQGAGSPRRRVFGLVTAPVLLVVGIWLGWPPSPDASPAKSVPSQNQSAPAVTWEKWSPEAVAAARAAGKTIYVDFTARWCATCQANKLAVFNSAAVLGYFHEHGVVALRADWTSRNTQITAELARFNRAAVPFNLIYKPGRPDPIVLPELLTPGIVLDALK